VAHTEVRALTFTLQMTHNAQLIKFFKEEIA